MRSGSCVLLVVCGLFFGCGDDDSMVPMDGGSDGAVCTDCDDDLFCNGVETCVGGVCQPGDAPCTGACDEDADRCADCEVAADADGDGAASMVCGGTDCDDSDPNRFPGNTEICDADDVDEDCDPTTFGFRDSDGDGVGDSACCNEGNCGEDCNDGNGNVRPGQTESCNDTDDDCDGVTDEGAATTYYADEDGDDFGDPDGESTMACSQPAGFSENDRDCDDTRGYVNPGVSEVCDDFGNNDCNDDTASPFDGDSDGFDRHNDESCPLGNDCDDDRAEVYPGAPDECDGDRRDCDAGGPEDADGDSQVAIDDVCMGGPFPKTDCDDDDPLAYDGALEYCDGVDNDCDGDLDEGGYTDAQVVAGDVCGTVGCDFSCRGVWDLGDPDPAPSTMTMQVRVGLSPVEDGDVEIWDGVPGAECAFDPRCEVKPVASGEVLVDLRVGQRFSMRHTRAGVGTTVTQLFTASEGRTIYALDELLMTTSTAPGTAGLVLPLNECGSLDPLAAVGADDVQIRLYELGVGALCVSRTESLSIAGLPFASMRNIPVPAGGREVVFEVVGRLGGDVEVLSRESVWLFPDQWTLAAALPLRITSPARP